MAEYDGMILTKAGMQLQAQAQLGGELQITKIAIGDGLLQSGERVEDLTALKNQLMILGIQEMAVTDGGQSRIRAVITNDNLTSGFFVREVGVFAKIGEGGTERLYSYTNAGDKADYLPGQGVNVVEEILEVYIIVGNAQKVTCVIDDRLMLATKLDIAAHDAAETAHADLLHLWRPGKAYLMGDIAHHPSLPSWAYLECVQGGISGDDGGIFTNISTDVIVDGNIRWLAKDIKVKDTDPLGTVKEYYGGELPDGYLWVDGRTIGDAESGATARANADIFDLYAVLWGAANVSGSQIQLYDSEGAATDKGDGAEEDFAAHKRLSLPDKRGRTAIGLDNMGGTSANIATTVNTDVLGGIGGSENITLTIEQIPSHAHSQHGNTIYGDTANISSRRKTGSDGSDAVGPVSSTRYTGYTGSGQPHPNMQPWIACNYIMRY